MPTRPCKVSVLDDIGSPDAEPGSAAWAKWMVGQAKLYVHDLEREAVGLQKLFKRLEKFNAWKALGFLSFEMLCAQALGLDAEVVEAVRRAKPTATIRSVIERAKNPKALAGHGGDRKSDVQVDNSNLKGGTQADYLTARIARDHPDILHRMENGEFPSVRAAAIEAGIVKVPSVLERVLKLLPKLTAAERLQVIEACEA